MKLVNKMKNMFNKFLILSLLLSVNHLVADTFIINYEEVDIKKSYTRYCSVFKKNSYFRS